MSKLKTSWDGHYMYPAFVGFVSFALQEPEILAQYRAETGDQYREPVSMLDKAIDEASGADLAFLQRFSGFCESRHFGTPDDLTATSQEETAA